MDLLNDPTPEPLARRFAVGIGILVGLVAFAHAIGWAIRHVSVTVNL